MPCRTAENSVQHSYDKRMYHADDKLLERARYPKYHKRASGIYGEQLLKYLGIDRYDKQTRQGYRYSNTGKVASE